MARRELPPQFLPTMDMTKPIQLDDKAKIELYKKLLKDPKTEMPERIGAIKELIRLGETEYLNGFKARIEKRIESEEEKLRKLTADRLAVMAGKGVPSFSDFLEKEKKTNFTEWQKSEERKIKGKNYMDPMLSEHYLKYIAPNLEKHDRITEACEERIKLLKQVVAEINAALATAGR